MPLLTRYREFTQNELAPTLAMQDEAVWVPGSATHSHRRIARPSAGRQMCSNLHCSGSWMLPWRNRKRPMLEGAWGCSSDCILSLARSAVMREAGDGLTWPREPHRHRIPLGLVMLAQGAISQAQLKRALEAQRSAGRGRIGEWLVAECGVEREQVLRGLGVQWNCPIFSPRTSVTKQMGFVLPKQLAGQFGVVPWRVIGSGTLQLAFVDNLDASVAFAVERMSGLQVQSGLLDERLFSEAHSSLLGCEAVAVSTQRVNGVHALAERVAQILEKQQPVASRLVRVHGYYWMRLWLEAGARDTIGSVPGSSEDIWDYVFQCSSNA